MARKKKDGRRDVGIWSRYGKLYIITTQNTIDGSGKRVNKKIWRATGLDDTQENISKAVALRDKLMNGANSFDLSKDILMPDLVDIFLEHKQRSLADTTYNTYQFQGEHIKAFFCGIRVVNVKTTDVEAFFDYLYSEKKLNKRYVKDIKAMLKGVMDFAITNSVILDNPVSEASLNKVLGSSNNSSKSDENFFTYDEAILFLKLIEGNELYEMFYLTLYFGLRREELLGLKWSCIDFIRKEMTINHTVTIGTRINRLDDTKTTASKRVYPLSDDVIKVLNGLKEKEDHNRELLGKNYNDNDYLFKHEDGSLYYPQYPTKAFSKLIKRFDGTVPTNVTLHGLRKSCASILVHKGIDIKTIQKWLGHSNIETTLKIYAQVKDSEAKKELSESMIDILPSKYEENK